MLSREYIESYHKHADELRKELTNIHNWSYKNIVKAIVKCVLNKTKPHLEYDCEHITVIDDGDYQGSYIFAIPKRTYQPAPFEYIFAYAYYGSCSGCDALLAAVDWNKPNMDEIMDIALNIFQSMKFLWSFGEAE